MIYLYLFWVFFKIGLFGFGGGYAMISLIRMDVVDDYQWMSASEFADLVAVSQMTPGPISINTATFVGFSEAGVLGSIIATFALCLPSILLMLLVLRMLMHHRESEYVKRPMSYMLPVVAGLIIAAGILMFNRETFSSWLSFVVFGGTVAAQLIWKTNPILLIVVSGVLGWASGIFSL